MVMEKDGTDTVILNSITLLTYRDIWAKQIILSQLIKKAYLHLKSTKSNLKQTCFYPNHIS